MGRKSSGKNASPRSPVSSRKIQSTPKKQALLNATRARGPLHCNRCEGRPLLKECKHSARGKKLAALEVEQAQASDIPGSSPTPMPQASETRSRCVSDSVIDPLLRGPTTPQRPPSTASFVQPPAMAPLRIFSLSSPTGPQSPLPPSSPMGPSSPCPSSPIGGSSPSPFMLESSTTKPRNRKPTLANPKYGFVEGSQRGGRSYEILRMKELPLPSPSQSKASDRFTYVMKDVIQRIERLGAETGAWIFIAGQHSHALSLDSFLSYASPALRRDALKHVEDLLNKFGDTVDGLQTLSKDRVIELTENCNKAQREKILAETEAREAREALAAQQEEMALLQSVLDDLASGAIQSHQIQGITSHSTARAQNSAGN
ncbi:hypothetical protein FPV67DRAFT_1448491 [Lyophyllum atratum]|nr:hypothetical protein FPV67DRAFT_1448491 [Lyophyllum atratum]